MKLWEIIREAQENGAKLHKPSWGDGIFIKWDGHKWINQNGKPDFCELDDRLGLYIEPIKTFGPDRAMYWLERGKMVKRKAWASVGDNVLIRDAERLLWFKGNNISTLACWFHDDWHLCDSEGNYIPEPEDVK